MLIPGRAFTASGFVFQKYTCENVGDGLPVHDHPFEHLTQILVGEVEIYSDDGVTEPVILRACDDPKPAKYRVGKRHGIRARTPGAVFQNVSPDLMAGA